MNRKLGYLLAHRQTCGEGGDESRVVRRTRLYAVHASKSIGTGALAVERIALGILAAGKRRKQAVEAVAEARSVG